MALRAFHSGAAALRIAAVTLSCARTLYGRAPIIFFFSVAKKDHTLSKYYFFQSIVNFNMLLWHL